MQTFGPKTQDGESGVEAGMGSVDICYCVINFPNRPDLGDQVCLVGHCLADLS